MDAVSLARAALDRQQHGMGRVASECNYIEAQVHGPTRFRPGCWRKSLHQQGIRARSAPAGSKRHGSMPWSPCSAASSPPPRTWTLFRRSSGPNLPPSGNSSAARLSLCALKSRFRSWISKIPSGPKSARSTPRTSIKPASTLKLHDVQQDDAGLQAFISQMLSIRPGGAAVSRILGTVPLVAGGGRATTSARKPLPPM